MIVSLPTKHLDATRVIRNNERPGVTLFGEACCRTTLLLQHKS